MKYKFKTEPYGRQLEALKLPWDKRVCILVEWGQVGLKSLLII